MFTGIIESIGMVRGILDEGSNRHFIIEVDFVHELKVDQSIAHNGACLTVVELLSSNYRITAVQETLHRTNLGFLKTGDSINLERCMKIGDRLDGHLVQGHVDETATCISKQDLNGSWKFGFSYSAQSKNITVEKGSICLNGVSLTVVESKENFFSVVIIPFTFEHTNFKSLKVGDVVNVEFDVIGKYVARMIGC